MTVSAGPGAQRELHLVIKNLSGSVEHYHHFLLGFLVPLLHHRRKTWLNSDFSRVLIRSCGPLDQVIDQLKLDKVATLDKREHQRIGASAPRQSLGRLLNLPRRRGALQFMETRGFDLPVGYDFKAFADAKEVVALRLRDAIAAARGDVDGVFGDARPRILLIHRGRPDPFYLSDSAESKGAGALRRSIRNHDELVERIAGAFGHCASVALEGLPLARQVALFAAADVIVAQHGAALANLIWADRRAVVIEIVPQTLSQTIKNIDFFGNLAWCLRQPHRRVMQADDHGDVDANLICEIIGESLRRTA